MPLEGSRIQVAAGAIVIAAAVPFIVGFDVPPAPTSFNQLAALSLWGLACAIAAPSSTWVRRVSCRAINPLVLAGAVVLVCIGSSAAVARLAGGLAMSALAAVGVAMLVAMSAYAVTGGRALVMSAFATGLVAAGVANAAIALVQVLAPAWPDGTLIVRSSLIGRAVGNLRQPNHLASLLLLSSIAAVALAAARSWPRWPTYVLVGFLVTGITLSASRTGMLGVGLLATWGVVDRMLAGRWRLVLLLAPLMCLVAWAGFSWWAARTSNVLAATARLAEADISGSRFAIWRDSLELIAMQPWAGVGWGNFNLAWSLTPFSERPTAFFDHAHNIVLQFVVELGLPLGVLVCVLMALALWRAGQRAWRTQGDSGVLARALFLMVLMMALHSQLEYPLWYAHFLLPTAFAWGACLGLPNDDAWAPSQYHDAGTVTWSPAMMALAGLVTAAGGVHATVDYLRISSIFTDGPHAQSVEQRITTGRRSLFFAHHADYARATTAEHPGDVMDSFDVAKYHLLDTRLMMAWARAYAERGDLDRARYIAERLREFRNPASKGLFAACDGDPHPRPFQCDPPSRQLTWRDFAGKE
jgi:Virulence factor membrane-bound polymerase, C-terminal/O-Antigen ligase/Protein glycosylation ligase